MKKNIVISLIFFTFLGFSQTKKMVYGAEQQFVDEEKYPEAIVLLGNVKMVHEGAVLTCKKALFYQKQNFFRAFQDVLVKQGDTITQNSDYVDYDANSKQALSYGNVVLKDPTMTLTTDTLQFDRLNQKLYYRSFATIKDQTNTLKSKNGNYYLETKKFNATTRVTVVNPEHNLVSSHLDYYTDSGLTYLYGPSTITNTENENRIYCERGFYNTKTDISYFVKNAKLYLKERTVEGDSLYYDKNKGFASATNNIQVIDTVKNFVTRGNYAEIFELKDSLYIIKRAVGISIVDKDSTFIHGDTILVTGVPEKRVVRTYHNVKIFKSDLQGKCDSIHTDQQNGVTKMFIKPVLWSEGNQITGDTIHLISDVKTEQLDSLKVLNNSFIISKDSLAENDFNQIKGRNMFGKFKENKLDMLLVKGNGESIYFNRNEETNLLETITKEVSSNIQFSLNKGEITTVKYLKSSEGTTYPPSKLTEDLRKLKGFVWREDEQPKIKEDIFTKYRKKEAPNKSDKDIIKPLLIDASKRGIKVDSTNRD